MSKIEIRTGESAEFYERRTATEPIFKGRIIDLIGARIRCESHEGRGTSFTVTLRVDSNTPAISR